MLGTGGGSYTNRALLKQVITNLDLDSDENLNKMKTKFLNMIAVAPSHPDPHYNMEFTEGMELLRGQMDTDIQKHVDKCK